MYTATAQLGTSKRNWTWIGFGGLAFFLISAAVLMPNLMRMNELPNNNLRTSQPAGLFVDQSPHSQVLAAAGSKTMVASAAMAARATPYDSPASFRKLVQTSSMELTVGNPAKLAEDTRRLAENFGGYLESMQVNGSQGSPSACVTIRVPGAHFEDAKAKLRALALHVDNERTDANDVTKQYVDIEARIRNLRAVEAQYLQIMKSAGKVEDMLDVSEKLSEVRGQIEQQQAEFETLSRQVETVAIAVTAHAEPGPEAFGIHWQPLHQIRAAARDALEGLAQYASSMISVILYLPVIFLWLATVTLGLVGGWKLLRWIARKFETSQAIEAAKPA
jgi:hypothetical protein